MKTAVETFTTSEGTGGYNNKPLNQFKITMKTAVEWLQEQYNQCPKYEEKIHDEDWDKALEMEKEQRQEDTNYGYSQGWDDGNQNKEPMRPELKQQEQ
jgi:hypothetical protein